MKRTLRLHPTVRASLSECPRLPPFSPAIRRRTGVPVYDVVSTADAVMAGFGGGR
jgi:hypothetical protein